ncbi:precorrin-3B synthase [Streptomyces sp. H10-C2]|uniref:precorrin-3B synthase n=1 Tax=unclassified Streptomyces TaxID=2593676 RepID=UPI0024B9BD37|nr:MULTISPECIES: precorrin-3B synthase [unclassified Streptomyces]MDJ0344759.1 precorrin-3B synthase [Streptomyces sp. PH10-H1]MDJ0371250.1 precorrin-3B synthase [Streptomyces sp. H10-C2]
MLAAMPMPSAPLPRREGSAQRDRGDACPGSLRLHAADDGALARIRIPAGVLTARQAQLLADAAERLGDGSLHLTSRGNVQLRGLDAGCGQQLADALAGAGLLPSPRHERVRNIVASPLSGLDLRGTADVQPWVRRLDGLLCASEAAAALSGRFLFALDDGRGDVAALGADVTLVAAPDSRALLWIGAAGEAIGVPAEDAARSALLTAEVFLTAARDAGADGSGGGGGGAWRVRELPGDPDVFVRDVLRHLAGRDIRAGLMRRTEPPGPVALPPAPGIVAGPDGRVALSAMAPLGRLTAAQWRLLTDTALHDGSGGLRLTPWRGVVLPGLTPGSAAERLAELSAAGLITGPESPWHGVGACIGQPGCAKSLADVRADAAQALGTGGGLPVYWSGCERRCGHPHGDWVDVVATTDGYDISLRGERLHTAVTVPSEFAAAVAAARTTTVTQ